MCTNVVDTLVILYDCQFKCMVEVFVRPMGAWPVPNSICATLCLSPLRASHEI